MDTKELQEKEIFESLQATLQAEKIDEDRLRALLDALVGSCKDLKVIH